MSQKEVSLAKDLKLSDDIDEELIPDIIKALSTGKLIAKSNSKASSNKFHEKSCC